MGQTLTNIRDDVRAVTGYNSADPLLQNADLTPLINLALQQISTEFDWPWLYAETSFPTVAGTTDYAVPTRWTRTLWLAIEDVDFDYRTHRQMRRIIGDTGVTRQPTVYSTVGDTSIRVGPIPDAVYTIDHGYMTSEDTLSADGDAPLLDDAYDDMLVWRAAKLAAARKSDSTMLGIAINEIQGWDTRVRDNVRRSAQFPRVKTRRDWTTVT